MQSPDITLLSLWSIFILEVIIAGLLFSERNKTKRFEKEYQKELKKTQEKLEKIVTSAAEEARTSLSRVSQNSVTASKEVASLAQKVQEKIEHTILNQTQETLKELQTSAKVQVSNLTEELTAAITHTKSEMHEKGQSIIANTKTNYELNKETKRIKGWRPFSSKKKESAKKEKGLVKNENGLKFPGRKAGSNYHEYSQVDVQHQAEAESQVVV